MSDLPIALQFPAANDGPNQEPTLFNYSSNDASGLACNLLPLGPFSPQTNAIYTDPQQNIQFLGICTIDGVPCDLKQVPRCIPVRVELYVKDVSRLPNSPIMLLRYDSAASKVVRTKSSRKKSFAYPIAVFDLNAINKFNAQRPQSRSNDLEAALINASHDKLSGGCHLTFLWKAGYEVQKAIALRLFAPASPPEELFSSWMEDKLLAVKHCGFELAGACNTGQYLVTFLLADRMDGIPSGSAGLAVDPDYNEIAFDAFRRDEKSCFSSIFALPFSICFTIWLTIFEAFVMALSMCGLLVANIISAFLMIPFACVSRCCNPQMGVATPAKKVAGLICSYIFGVTWQPQRPGYKSRFWAMVPFYLKFLDWRRVYSSSYLPREAPHSYLLGKQCQRMGLSLPRSLPCIWFDSNGKFINHNSWTDPVIDSILAERACFIAKSGLIRFPNLSPRASFESKLQQVFQQQSPGVFMDFERDDLDILKKSVVPFGLANFEVVEIAHLPKW